MAKLNVNERRPLENVQSERNAEPVSSTEEPKASSSSKPKARTRSFSKETTKKPVASAKPRPVQTRVQPSLAGSTTVTKAPAAAMYFSPCPAHGFPPERPLRAHTGVLVGQKIYVIGGCDSRGCWRDMASFDTETFMWNPIDTHGEELPPLRAHTATLVGDLIYVFGGGDGPSYSNEVWVFDTSGFYHCQADDEFSTGGRDLTSPRLKLPILFSAEHTLRASIATSWSSLEVATGKQLSMMSGLWTSRIRID